MKKTICLLSLLFLLFIARNFSTFAAGEITPNPNVPGSGVTNPNVTPNPNVPGSGVTSGNSSAETLTKSTQGATPTGGGSQSSGFPNPLRVDSIEGVLGNIMSYLQKIAGTIAVIFIIIGGIMYMISGGSKDMAERAKKTLIFAIVGLAIVLAAPLFYTEIKAVLSGSSPGSALQALLLNILKLLLAIVGFLAIISMVVGAIWMLTAVGDEDRYELGKKTAGYSILGLVIALSALIIANQVTNLVGGGSSSSIINNAANSPVTGSSSSSSDVQFEKAGETTTTQRPDGSLDLVGITETVGETTPYYVYKDEKGNYWTQKKDATNGSGLFQTFKKEDVIPITTLGTLVRTNNTVGRDFYGNYFEMGGTQPVPLKLQDGDAINYFPSKK